MRAVSKGDFMIYNRKGDKQSHDQTRNYSSKAAKVQVNFTFCCIFAALFSFYNLNRGMNLTSYANEFALALEYKENSSGYSRFI